MASYDMGLVLYLIALKKDREDALDAEVARYLANPGGKGVTRGYLTNDRGEICGRYADSNNPEWYQLAYQYFGRRPPKSRLREFADWYMNEYCEDYGRTCAAIAEVEAELARQGAA